MNARTLAYVSGAERITPTHFRTALAAGGEFLPPCGCGAIRFSEEAARLWKRAFDAAGGLNEATLDHLRAVLDDRSERRTGPGP